MYNLEEYIRNRAERLPWVSEPDKQIFSAAGLDMAAGLLENYADKVYPLIIVEDICEGYVSYEAEFLDNAIKNFWVMERVENPEVTAERLEAMKRCFDYGNDILKLLTSDYYDFPIATGWNRKRTGYIPMSNVGHCFGYMFTLGFYEDLSFII